MTLYYSDSNIIPSIYMYQRSCSNLYFTIERRMRIIIPAKESVHPNPLHQEWLLLMTMIIIAIMIEMAIRRWIIMIDLEMGMREVFTVKMIIVMASVTMVTMIVLRFKTMARNRSRSRAYLI